MPTTGSRCVRRREPPGRLQEPGRRIRLALPPDRRLRRPRRRPCTRRWRRPVRDQRHADRGCPRRRPGDPVHRRRRRRHEVRCEVIVGADGPHSVCRQQLPETQRRTFSKEYPFAWFGFLVEAPPSAPELVYTHSDRGFALVSQRTSSMQRMYFQCAPDEDVSAWSDDRIWAEIQSRVAGPDGFALQEGAISDQTVLRFRSFVCEPMRYGNLLLAGDAAHTVPPTGAKGLNLALADVRILAACLERALAGRDADALDQYGPLALDRVWRSQHFSYWMTQMLHALPDGDRYDRRRQVADSAASWAPRPARRTWPRATPAGRRADRREARGGSAVPVRPTDQNRYAVWPCASPNAQDLVGRDPVDPGATSGAAAGPAGSTNSAPADLEPPVVAVLGEPGVGQRRQRVGSVTRTAVPSTTTSLPGPAVRCRCRRWSPPTCGLAARFRASARPGRYRTRTRPRARHRPGVRRGPAVDADRDDPVELRLGEEPLDVIPRRAAGRCVAVPRVDLSWSAPQCTVRNQRGAASSTRMSPSWTRSPESILLSR